MTWPWEAATAWLSPEGIVRLRLSIRRSARPGCSRRKASTMARVAAVGIPVGSLIARQVDPSRLSRGAFEGQRPLRDPRRPCEKAAPLRLKGLASYPKTADRVAGPGPTLPAPPGQRGLAGGE